MKTKPICSLSLDLDNQWSYMKTHGDEGWESFPSYLDVVVPRFLEVMEDLEVKMTVFIVGQDADLEKNHEALRKIPAAGHEVGNHSYNHEPWLHLYSEAELRTEIERAENAIESATGRRPKTWRGPGFSFSRTVLEVLSERGYVCDASTFPTFLGPLARAYYFMKSGLGDEDRETRARLFGKLSEGFRPLKPYFWDLGEGHRPLLEIPVTTMPILKAPFHLSYLLYLATFSPAVAKAYLWQALAMCRVMGVEPSFLLHPLDFLGADDVPELAFFPAMNRGGAWKVSQAKKFLGMLAGRFEIVTMEQHAAAASAITEREIPRLALEVS